MSLHRGLVLSNSGSTVQYFVRKIIAFPTLLFVLISLGCSGNRLGSIAGNLAAKPDPNVELLESELRWMEDNLYRIDDQLDRCLEQLESARRNNAVLRFELSEALNSKGTRTNASSGDSSRPPGSKDDRPYDEESTDLNDDELLDLRAPEVKLGEPEKAATDGTRDPSVNSENTSSELSDGPNDDEIIIEGFPELPEPKPIPTEPSIDSGAPATKPDNPFKSDEGGVSTDHDVVTRILLNRQLTGGYNFDGKPGHEGVMVVIEPQNAYAQFLPTAGNLTIEIHDPAKKGLERRVGKWTFDAAEVSALIKTSLIGKGIHVQLPWPNTPPDAEELLLTVEYETTLGRKLRAEKKLRIEPLTSALVAKAVEAERRWSPNRPPDGPTTGSNAPSVGSAADLEWQPNR